ncbi:MAG: arsenic efflux protein [Lachnospiraceae bacterium]|nr:arsenic efflux protein [Lachnospiraceae bacterium]
MHDIIHTIAHCLEHALEHNIKLLFFLFLTYLLMEYLEHKAGHKSNAIIKNSGNFGPLLGGILGAAPQCGFSAAASSLYAGKVITMGTLIAIYLSTSDEMLPIFLSEAVEIETIAKILGIKILLGVITGYIVDTVYKLVNNKDKEEMNIHAMCEHERCNCKDGIIRSAVKHTVKIFIFILIVSFAINLTVELVGEDTLESFLTKMPVLSVVVAAIIGLIPNCASSVVITRLYLEEMISFGAMMSGLLVGAGIGLAILFRTNKSKKENGIIVATLFGSGVIWGILIDIAGIII